MSELELNGLEPELSLLIGSLDCHPGGVNEEVLATLEGCKIGVTGKQLVETMTGLNLLSMDVLRIFELVGIRVVLNSIISDRSGADQVNHCITLGEQLDLV